MASLRISWSLAKARKPFADAELMKTCAIDMVEEVLSHDGKTKKTVVDLLKQPFSASADGQWTAEAKRLLPSLDEASLQMEILEMSKSDLLKEQHKNVSVTDFWINMIPQFSQTRRIAMLLLTVFPSTYIYEGLAGSEGSRLSSDRGSLTERSPLRTMKESNHPKSISMFSKYLLPGTLPDTAVGNQHSWHGGGCWGAEG
ncbi:hypothetical protein SRHO_G00024940 [Serrasalmus rhombeus]